MLPFSTNISTVELAILPFCMIATWPKLSASQFWPNSAIKLVFRNQLFGWIYSCLLIYCYHQIYATLWIWSRKGGHVCLFCCHFLKKGMFFFSFSPYRSSAIIGKDVFEGDANGATSCFELECLLISNIILQGNHTAMERPISWHSFESTFPVLQFA